MSILPVSRSPFQAEAEPEPQAPAEPAQPATTSAERSRAALVKAREAHARNTAARHAAGWKPKPKKRQTTAEAKAARLRAIAAINAETPTPPQPLITTDLQLAPDLTEPPQDPTEQPLATLEDITVSLEDVDQAATLPAGDITSGSIPTLPPHLAGLLTPQDYRAVLELVRGRTWAQACDAAGIKAYSPVRKAGPTKAIRESSVWILGQLSESCATSRTWIIRNVVNLFRRATQAEEVRDRFGRGIGVFRYDGATAVKCLEMLGKDMGMFGNKDRGIAPSDVAQLLAAVASRGRPALPGDRARVVNQAPSAPRQPVEDSTPAPQHTAAQQPEK